MKITHLLARTILFSAATLQMALAGVGAAAMSPVVPLTFEPGSTPVALGAWFQSRSPGYSARFDRSGVIVRGRSGEFGMHWLYASTDHPDPVGTNDLAARTNYISGSDPSRWRVNVPNYGSILYRELYPGIDLIFHGENNRLEYDFIVKPGADTGVIELQFDGVNRLRLDGSDLVVRTSGAEFRQSAPAAYQDTDGQRTPVTVSYALHNGNRVSFLPGSYNPHKPLIIDPVLSYSVRIGGSGIRFVVTDQYGNSWLAGITNSSDLPTTDGAYDRTLPNLTQWVFVMKFNASGSLAWSTFISTDTVVAMAVDSSGCVYLTGYGSGADLPITSGAFESSHDTGYVLKLNAQGSGLVYSTYFPGTPAAIGVDGAGNAYVAGSTTGTNFPITSGVFSPIYNGGKTDGFLSKLNPQGSALVYSTFVGGPAADGVSAIAVDAAGSVWLTGTMDRCDGCTSPNGFVIKLNRTASAEVFAQSFGGSSGEYPASITIDSSGNAYVSGTTYSQDFHVTPNAYRSSPGGSNSAAAFLTKLNGAGNFIYSTYFGAQPGPVYVAVADDGTVWLAGTVMYAGAGWGSVPLRGSLQNVWAAAFVARFDTTRSGDSSLLFSSVIGPPPITDLLFGTYSPVGITGVAGIPGGSALVIGTVSGAFPTTQTGYGVGGSWDAFVARFSDSGSCSYSAINTGGSIPSGGGITTVSITAGAGCSWTWHNTEEWLVPGSTGTKSGNGSITFTATANSAMAPRNGALTVAGQVIYVTQAAGTVCPYTLSETSHHFDAHGGTGTLTVTTVQGCDWSVASNAAWITPNVVASNSSYTFTYSVSPNASLPATARTGTMTVAGQTVTVSQDGLALITSPGTGSELPGTSATFSWNAAPGAQSYELQVISHVTQAVFFDGTTSGLSLMATGLPCDQSSLYVVLLDRFSAATYSLAFDFTAWSGCASAQLVSPAAGAMLFGVNVPFTWLPVANATNYKLEVGSAAGKNDYASVTTAGATTTISGLPCDQSPVYAQLSTFRGAWLPAVQYAFTASLTCGNIPVRFQAPLTLTGPGRGSRTVVADFNQDGNPDVAEAGAGSVTILPGKGDGSFRTPVSIPVNFNASTPFNVGDIAAGDVYGRGRQDLILFGGYSPFAQQSALALAVLPGNGDGTFQTPVFTTLSSGTSIVSVVDLNRDGRADVVLLDNAGTEVLFSNGDGTFQSPVNISSSAGALAIADFNNDGAPDFLFAARDQAPQTIYVMFANGAGGFTSGTPIPFFYVTGAIVADVNNDGNPDIIAFGEGDIEAHVLLGNGDGTFAPPSTIPIDVWPIDTSVLGMAVADLDGDGFPDLVVIQNTNYGSAVDVLLGNGDGTFRSPVHVGELPIAGPSPVLTDLNHDGKPDLLLAGFSTLEVLLNQTPPPIPQPLLFVPIAPCRLADTRNSPVGAFAGPAIKARTSRKFTIPNSSCGVPATAAAYSLNVTVAPQRQLGYVTLWPAGQTQPTVSTLNSLDGRIKADAAIVPAGAKGGVSVFATDQTDVVLDINGYFVPATDTTALAFYPLTPCRVADTRAGSGPSLTAGESRTFAIAGSCSVPSTAQAYSLNFTAVPRTPLGYLTVWPTGQQKPVVSTLNALTGAITANAAIVTAGTSGDLDVYATDATDLIIDVNGYFAGAGAGGLSFYSPPPCRVLDTRNPAGSHPISAELDVNFTSSTCGVPSTAKAYVFNATVVPPAPLGYLSLWPQGEQQPVVSTLNAFDGAITSNMAIVPTTNGSISAFPSSATHLILDIAGYFAP